MSIYGVGKLVDVNTTEWQSLTRCLVALTQYTTVRHGEKRTNRERYGSNEYVWLAVYIEYGSDGRSFQQLYQLRRGIEMNHRQSARQMSGDVGASRDRKHWTTKKATLWESASKYRRRGWAGRRRYVTTSVSPRRAYIKPCSTTLMPLVSITLNTQHC